MHPDLAGRMGEHPVPVSQFYTKHGVGQILFDHSFNFYRFLLSHKQRQAITSTGPGAHVPRPKLIF